MRALQFSEYGPASVLHVGEVPEPHAGPGQVRISVRAAGLTPADAYFRSGRFRDWIPLDLPHTFGHDAAGVVDEVGAGVTDVGIGDEVFGSIDASGLGGAVAEFAVLGLWVPKPATLTWEEAGGLAGNAETAERVLTRLGVKEGMTLLIEGAAGGAGSITAQFAVALGATVIGTAGPGNQEFLASLGVQPTSYGPGLADRVRDLAPGGVDAVLDAAASGSLPELIAIAGSPDKVVTIADLKAGEYGVHLSRGAGPGADPLAIAGPARAAALAEQGRLTQRIAGVFPLEQAAEAHELSETGHAPGKIIFTP